MMNFVLKKLYDELVCKRIVREIFPIKITKIVLHKYLKKSMH